MKELSTIISALRSTTEKRKLKWKREDGHFYTEVDDVEFVIGFDSEAEMIVLSMREPGTPGCRTASYAVDNLYDDIREQDFCWNGPADRVHAALQTTKIRVTKRLNSNVGDG